MQIGGVWADVAQGLLVLPALGGMVVTVKLCARRSTTDHHMEVAKLTAAEEAMRAENRTLDTGKD